MVITHEPSPTTTSVVESVIRREDEQTGFQDRRRVGKAGTIPVVRSSHNNIRNYLAQDNFILVLYLQYVRFSTVWSTNQNGRS